jgi:5-methylcytosine-specific restriction endonuclease McrA
VRPLSTKLGEFLSMSEFICTNSFENCCKKVIERRFQTKSNGVVIHVMQCNKCGKYTSNKIKKDGSNVPELDFDLIRRNRDATNRHFEAIKYGKTLDTTTQQAVSAKDDYRIYLQSDEWKAKRRLIIERDKICQGCLGDKIDDVHHLTYENVKNEFAFELIGLCRDCHSRLHQK